MKTIINTLMLDKDNNLKNIKMDIVMTPGIGIHVLNMPDVAIKETLLRTITAMQSIGYRIPAKKIVISFSEYVENGYSLTDAAIAMGLLIASGQVKPVIKHEMMCIAGELSLDGKLRTPLLPQEINYATSQYIMYVVPEELDTKFETETDCESLAINSLKGIVNMIKAPNLYVAQSN